MLLELIADDYTRASSIANIPVKSFIGEGERLTTELMIISSLEGGIWHNTVGFTGTWPRSNLTGSCARAKRAKIARHQNQHPSRAIPVDIATEGSHALVSLVLENKARSSSIVSLAEPEAIAHTQARYGCDEVSARWGPSSVNWRAFW